MKIKSLRLENFKRFTDLTLQDIPDNAKLVLLIGSNGSGKSSVFDAFELINKVSKNERPATTKYYYSKNDSYKISFSSDNELNEQFIMEYSSSLADLKNGFYGRSAVRYLSRLKRTVIGNPINIDEDGDRPNYYIDRDDRFENDIDLLLTDIVKKVFGDLNDKTKGTINEVRKFIEKLNESLARIFKSQNYNQLQLINFETPADGKPAQLLFKKGTAEINYDLLSSGEKEIINLLINLYTRASHFNNTIYFFDEIDAHLNTTLQYNFLKEVVENWIPDNCQFWTASHSLGFIQYAKDYAAGCIFDLDDLDFDKKQVLEPQAKNNFEIFEIAVSKVFIDEVVQGRKIIFSENTDTSFYNDLNINQTLFFVALDKKDVFHKAKNLKQFGLIDRDYLSDNEIENLKKDYPNLFVLPYYSFENLLFHPDNLEEYYTSAKLQFDKSKYIEQLIEIKNKERDYISAGIIQARGGYPFYKENENAPKLKVFKENYKEVIDLLRSDELETFYKVFPAKDYGKTITERQKLSTQNLAKTNWFKTQIQNIIQ